ncbi:YdcF family protein [Nostoc sphaeroides CCNUC1]|uniref:YdcF family protein n=1 Tax=Nostoc sphaeroides CCNUC1 TaxID=2653204 RepID=A0A5P8WBX5_9NOSO|nr:YdcF family protein [Nostoc sphaeroides CCNUC1]
MICLASLSLIFILLSIIPLQLAIAINQAPQPQAFLMLGGDPAREKFTAELAQWYPSLEIWVSSPPNTQKTDETFQAVGISKSRLHIDIRATDTVTNFTSVVGDFKQRQLQHLFLITSDFHMLRAKAIATFILGSQGIAFTAISVPSKQTNSESLLRIIRDIVRSLLWIATGHTGASL